MSTQLCSTRPDLTKPVEWVERSETHHLPPCYARAVANYRRNFICGGSFFFTANLAERRLRLLVDYIVRRKMMGFAAAQPILRATCDIIGGSP
jgi:hypothetical protein